MTREYKEILNENYVTDFDAEVIQEDNHLHVSAHNDSQAWASVTIRQHEGMVFKSGRIYGDLNNVRLFKSNAIAAARAILKHYGEGLE